MAKLAPPNNVRLTKRHYEWLAWSIREVAFANQSVSSIWPHSMTETDRRTLTRLALDWADQCKGTNPAFKRDRFISAVVNGEW